MRSIVGWLRQRLLSPLHGASVRSRLGARPARSFGQNPSGTDVGLGQVERECAAFAGFASQMYFAPEKVCEFATDREPQTGSSVSPIGAGVRLLEGLEYDALLFRENADAGIAHLERDDGGCGRKHRMSWRPT